MKDIDRKDLKKEAIKGTFWKFSERISAQLVSVVVSVILARILIPEDYSVVGIVAIFFTFSDVIISGGFNTALIQKKDADELDYSSVLFLTMAVSAVIYLALFFSAGFLARLYKTDLLVPVLRVMGLTLFINAYKSILSALVSSRLEFRKYFVSTIGGTLVSAVIGIVMALRGFGPWALVAQQMSNSLIDTLILSISTKYKPLLKVSFERLKSLFRYGVKIYISSIVSTVYEQIKPLIVGIRYSTVDLAYYSKGESFPALLNYSISDTLSAVLFPVIAKVQDDTDAVKNVTRKFMGTASFVVFPAMIGLFAIADSFVSAILTDKWLPIVPYIRIFCFSYMFNIVQIGNLQAIKAIGRSDVVLKLEILKKSSYLVIIFCFIMLSSSPEVLAMSTIATTIVASLANSFPNRRLIGYRYREQVMDLLPNLISSVIMGFVVYLMGRISMNSVLLMILQILTGAVTYWLIAVISGNRNYSYMLETVRQMMGKRG